MQTCADDGRDHIILHADFAKPGLRSAVESRGETSRGHMPEKLVEKLPVHPQLFRLQKYGNVTVVYVHIIDIKCVVNKRKIISIALNCILIILCSYT